MKNEDLKLSIKMYFVVSKKGISFCVRKHNSLLAFKPQHTTIAHMSRVEKISTWK